MNQREVLRHQLLTDLNQLHDLILRCAAGNRLVRPERDQLEGAVQVKFALWRAARCGFDRKA